MCTSFNDIITYEKPCASVEISYQLMLLYVLRQVKHFEMLMILTSNVMVVEVVLLMAVVTLLMMVIN